MNKKIEIKNPFFELIFLIISLAFSFFRSFKLMFFGKKVNRNLFFLFLNFIFKKWPKYFWKKPTLYKLISFPGTVINYVFKK